MAAHPLEEGHKLDDTGLTINNESIQESKSAALPDEPSEPGQVEGGGRDNDGTATASVPPVDDPDKSTINKNEQSTNILPPSKLSLPASSFSTTSGPLHVHPLSPDLSQFKDTSSSTSRRTSYFRISPSLVSIPKNVDALFTDEEEQGEDEDESVVDGPQSGTAAGDQKVAGLGLKGKGEAGTHPDDGRALYNDSHADRAVGLPDFHGEEGNGGSAIMTPKLNRAALMGNNKDAPVPTLREASIRLSKHPHQLSLQELQKRLEDQETSSDMLQVCLLLVQEMSRQAEEVRSELALQKRRQELREAALLQLLNYDSNSNVTEGMINRAILRANTEAIEAHDKDTATESKNGKPWKVSLHIPGETTDKPRNSGNTKARRIPLSEDLEDAMSENDFKEVASQSLSVSQSPESLYQRESSIRERRGRHASHSISSMLFGSFTPPPSGSNLPSSSATSLLSPNLPTLQTATIPSSANSSKGPSSSEASPIAPANVSKDKSTPQAKRRAGSIRSVASNASSASHGGASNWSLFGWKSSKKHANRDVLSDDEEDQLSNQIEGQESSVNADHVENSADEGSETDKETKNIRAGRRRLSKSSMQTNSTRSYETTAATSLSSSQQRRLRSNTEGALSSEDESTYNSPAAPRSGTALNQAMHSGDKDVGAATATSSPIKDSPVKAFMGRRMSGLHPDTAKTSHIVAVPLSPSLTQTSSSSTSARTSASMLQSISSLHDLAPDALPDTPRPGHFRAISETATTVGQDSGQVVPDQLFKTPNKVSSEIDQWTRRLLLSVNLPSTDPAQSIVPPTTITLVGDDYAEPGAVSPTFNRSRSPRLNQSKSKAAPSPATLLSDESTVATVKLSAAASPPNLSPIETSNPDQVDEAVFLGSKTSTKQKGYLASAKGTIGRALGLSTSSSSSSLKSASGTPASSLPQSPVPTRSSLSSPRMPRRRSGVGKSVVEPTLTLPAAFMSFPTSAGLTPSMSMHSANTLAPSTLEMGTIVKPEAKPPTLSADLSDQMREGPLVDRFGFVYDIKAGMKLLKETRKRQQKGQEDDDSDDVMSLDLVPNSVADVNVEHLREALGPSPNPTPALESAAAVAVLESAAEATSPASLEPAKPLAPAMTKAPSNQTIRRLLNQLGEMNESVEKAQKEAWDAFIKQRRGKIGRSAKDDDPAAAAKAKKKRATFAEAPLGNNASLNDDDLAVEQFTEHLVGVASMGVGKEDDRTFRKLVRAGIPIVYRPAIWAEVSGASELREPGLYYDLLTAHKGENSPCLEQIDMDTHRTFPTNVFFAGNGPGVDKLRRVLIAYSWRDPAIGYCQGMNLLAALLLLVYPDEEDAFWMLASVLEKILPSDYYSSQLLVSQADQRVLQDLLKLALPELYQHLEDLGVDLPAMTFRWFLSLFTDALPIQTLLRVWDVLLVYGPITLFKIALAIFKIHSSEIFATDSASSFYVLLTNLTSHLYSADKLLKAAFDDLRFIKRQDIEARRLRHVADLERELAPPPLAAEEQQ